MKKMRKLIALLMTAIMVMGFATTAMADETTYTITINGKEGHTYEVYQIFTGDLSDNVLSNIVWGNGVTDAGKTDLGTAATVAEGLTEDNIKAFADSLDGKLQNAQIMTAGTADENGNVAYTLDKLVPGYYLIKDKNDSQEGQDGTYTAYMLKVVKDVTAEPKDSVPSVDKSVTSDGVNAEDVSIGDTVTFILKATLGDNIDEFEKYKVVFHDTLSAGLTFKEYVSATLDGNDVKTSFTHSETGTTLTFTCDDVISLGAKDESVIIITYTATLNSAAEIGAPGNSNKVYLEYSNDPTHSGEGEDNPTGNTPEDEVLVFTYELDVTKVDGKNTSNKLKDAEFKLLNEEQTKVAEVVNGKFVQWLDIQKDTEGNITNGTTLKSDEDGKFVIAGLDAGTYYLKETKAPAGYNLLADPIKVEIIATLNTEEDSAALTTLQIKVDDGTAVEGILESGIVETTVKNNAGATLPETGGMGTTILYVVGAIMMIGAAVLLITRKRMA